MSPFNYDSTGIDPDNTHPLMPDGWYTLKIVEAEETKSKAGNPMIKVVCKAVNEPSFEDIEVWHWVVFIPKGQKGEGMNVIFRKAIGVPVGGNDVVDADDWVGRKFKGYVIQESYEGKKRNKIDRVENLESPMPQEEEIPF